MIEPTLFHKIILREIPADIVYETDTVLAFKDINPKAPTHLLFIAKQEKDFVPSIIGLTEQTTHVPGVLIEAAREFAEKQGITGYRLTFHCGKGGGQEVFYLHLHFLSSQELKI